MERVRASLLQISNDIGDKHPDSPGVKQVLQFAEELLNTNRPEDESQFDAIPMDQLIDILTTEGKKRSKVGGDALTEDLAKAINTNVYQNLPGNIRLADLLMPTLVRVERPKYVSRYPFEASQHEKARNMDAVIKAKYNLTLRSLIKSGYSDVESVRSDLSYNLTRHRGIGRSIAEFTLIAFRSVEEPHEIFPATS